MMLIRLSVLSEGEEWLLTSGSEEVSGCIELMMRLLDSDCETKALVWMFIFYTHVLMHCMLAECRFPDVCCCITKFGAQGWCSAPPCPWCEALLSA